MSQSPPQNWGLPGMAAILTAAGRDNIHAVGALYPAATAPSAVTAAAHTTAPGLIIGPGKATDFDSNESVKIAAQWAGPVTYREVSKGTQSGFSEGAVVKALVGMGRPQFSAQEKARGLLTGFLLYQLEGEKKYAAFAQEDVHARGLSSLTKAELQAKEQDKTFTSLPF